MKKTVWLSFDLGVRGDYEGMFQLLAEADAKECGSNLAVLSVQTGVDVMSDLKDLINTHVKTDKRSRIYAVYTKPDGKPAGKFLFGARKSPPWAGFGVLGGDEEDESE